MSIAPAKSGHRPVLGQLKAFSPLNLHPFEMNGGVLSEQTKYKAWPWTVMGHLPSMAPCALLTGAPL